MMWVHAVRFLNFVYRRINSAIAGNPIRAPFIFTISLSLLSFIIFLTNPLYFSFLTLLTIPNSSPSYLSISPFPNPPPPLNLSKITELAELDLEEESLTEEILDLLEETLDEIVGSAKLHAQKLRNARPLILRWSDRRFQKNITPATKILSNLLNFTKNREKFKSCAVVGNSGVLLQADYGPEIDSNAAVIRLKNAPIRGMSRHVGTKTTISFINSNTLHRCARLKSCHPYGVKILIVLYICQPLHFIDVAACNSGNILVTDPEFDRLCAKIAKYYSLKRWFNGGRNRSLSDWNNVHDGKLFHYSTGMQAVAMAVGVCEKVNLFGFGKSETSHHHYHTNQTAELKIHDYEAEYEFYRDLMDSPEKIPFINSAVGSFQFPDVVIHRWPVVLRRKKSDK